MRLKHFAEQVSRIFDVEDVMVHCVIDQEGRPMEIEVVSSSNRRLNRYVMEAMEQWRFEPASFRGQPVKTRIKVPFRFYQPGNSFQ